MFVYDSSPLSVHHAQEGSQWEPSPAGDPCKLQPCTRVVPVACQHGGVFQQAVVVVLVLWHQAYHRPCMVAFLAICPTNAVVAGWAGLLQLGGLCKLSKPFHALYQVVATDSASAAVVYV